MALLKSINLFYHVSFVKAGQISDSSTTLCFLKCILYTWKIHVHGTAILKSLNAFKGS